MASLVGYCVKRVLLAIPVLLAVSVLGFTLMRFDITIGPVSLPGITDAQGQAVVWRWHLKNPIDPLAHLKNNPQISRAVYAHERERLGLDKPLPVQYWRWLQGIIGIHPGEALRGQWHQVFQWPNLGQTFNGDDVSTLLMQRASNTLLLNAIVILITWLVALPLGVYGALHWRKLPDRLLTVAATVGMATPSFVLALLLAVWVVQTGILPLGGIATEGADNWPWWAQWGDTARHLALPVFVLTVGGIASLQRQMRGNLLEVLQAEYVRAARARGVSEMRVVYGYAVRTALNPLITLLGYEFAALLSGALLVEMVLNFPGLGLLTYQAVLDTDTNLVMVTLLLSSAMLILGNLLADILLKWVDPRIELA